MTAGRRSSGGDDELRDEVTGQDEAVAEIDDATGKSPSRRLTATQCVDDHGGGREGGERGVGVTGDVRGETRPAPGGRCPAARCPVPGARCRGSGAGGAGQSKDGSKV
jgi:hypothetical protein